MNVLSLFDGLSCGQIALNKLSIKIDNYFASEINKNAITITQNNFPDTIQLGNIANVQIKNLPQIDLLIGGSPCQGFSFAGKQLNFSDPRSKLFFEYVRLLKECKPKYFLLENVRMQQEFLDIISDLLNVQPIMINSADFSPHDRKRYYWTNIPYTNYTLINKTIVQNILEPEHKINDKYYINPKRPIHILDNKINKRKIAYIGSDSQANRIYKINNKSVCLCGDAGGLGAKTGLYAIPVEVESNNYKFYTIGFTNSNEKYRNHYIRKLTPIECERLQTVPDNYTSGVTDNQRYKMLGNGWTVDVIAHLLKGIKEN